jgi:hypothetical protein
MSKRTTQNRASSCAFTSAHGRQCTMPRATSSEYCYHHDRKLRYSKEAEQAALEIFQPISGNFIPAHALTESLARLFARVADGRISPNQASAMSKVADVLLRSVSHSTAEFKSSYRDGYFQQLVRESYGDLPPIKPRVFPKRYTYQELQELERQKLAEQQKLLEQKKSAPALASRTKMDSTI